MLRKNSFYSIGFFSFFFLFLFLNISVLYGREFCHYDFRLPNYHQILAQEKDILVAMKKYVLPISKKVVHTRWTFNCIRNLRRTNRLPELLQNARKKKELIHYVEKLFLDQGIESLIWSRTRIQKGHRLASMEVYFSTRNYEYNVYIIGERKAYLNVKGELHNLLLSQLKKMLKNSKFNLQAQKTITEAEYQYRLYIFLFILLFICLFTIFFVTRMLFKSMQK